MRNRREAPQIRQEALMDLQIVWVWGEEADVGMFFSFFFNFLPTPLASYRFHPAANKIALIHPCNLH